jgi:hypothetical protein
MKTFNEEDVASWNAVVGRRVWKNPHTTPKFQPKPYTSHLAFTFYEDDSCVECFRCSIAPKELV